MQERFIFRELLSEIKELADRNGNCLTMEEIRDFFQNAHLTEEQLKMVCEYLVGEKISIAGFQSEKNSGKETEEMEEEAALRVESDYLEIYQAEIEEIPGISEERELELFQLSSAGDQNAKKLLTEQYLKTVFDLSRTFAYGPMGRGDLIQEGNVALMLALEELEFLDDLEEYRNFLYGKISKSMQDALNDQQDIREMDEKIAERVNHLSEAIHNLERDLEHKVSVEELSAYLEMPVEEIEDILKMAGDEIEIEGHHHQEEE